MAGDSQWTPELIRRWDEGVVRYPDPAVEVLDSRFASYRLGNAAIERLYTGARWLEGPVWFGDSRSLVFSDIPNNRMLRYCELTNEVTPFRAPSNNSNGNTRDRQGRLVSCEHLTRRVTRTEHDGSITVLIDRFEGKPLNAPNDVVVHSDGAVWFTDPGYGILMNYEGQRAEAVLPTRVYRLDTATGAATVVADDLVKPNGLCFSPDESRLYVSDSAISHDPNAPGHVRVFDVVDGRKLRGGRGVRRHVSRIRRRHAHGSRRQPVVQPGLGGRRHGRGALSDARRRTDWPYHPAGTLLKPVFRRRPEEPSVHDQQPIPVFALRGGRRQPDTLTIPSCCAAKGASRR